ncbi:hypothetical protein Aeqsu_0637 [Aequorivita sublithincola DSM 14238]|uniref:DUF4266 domain-containing protein n=2 Tax=Aequorivita TaxID=153265 RepID=I3YT28_AEQSU|nr:hypothetical protein Aeqsu_0637 [Aequorivita sublithincola DSM 14238]
MKLLKSKQPQFAVAVRKTMKNIIILFSIIILGSLSSCTVVKEYEKVKLNDPDMALSDKAVDRFEINAQAYREAASGANGGKTGGGCGCN